MLDRQTPPTNGTTLRTNARGLPLRVALALACAAGVVCAQTTPAAKPSQPSAQQGQAKPAAPRGTRARRVGQTDATAKSAERAAPPASTKRQAATTPKAADASARGAAKPDASAKGATTTKASSPEGEAEPANKVKSAGAVKSAGEVQSEGEAGSESPASEAAESSPAGGTAKVGAAKAAAPAGAAGVEWELNELRAQIKNARPEQRAALQRALVDRLVALDRKADALGELRLMIHEDRIDPAFFYNTGNALARLGDANAAADAYRKAVSQRRGNYSRALNNLGVVLTRQGRWDEAHEVLTSALTQENFTYAEASYNLGRLHLLRGQTNLALREWARTLRLQPDHADAAAALARAYAEDGDSGRALALLEKFTARALREGGGVPREIAYAREAVVAGRARGGDGDAKAAPSGGSAGAGVRPEPARGSSPARPASAAASSSQLRTLSVDRITYNTLESARAANERGRYEEAVRHYRSALSRSDGYLPPASLELSSALVSLGRDAEAAAPLRALAERDGARYPVAHYLLARLHERLGQPALAVEHFARAAEIYGDANPQVLLDLSRAREKTGDVRGALEAVESYAAAIAGQGSVPHWVVERADALRAKLKAAQVK